MKSSTRWGWTVGVIAATGFALVLTFVVSLITQGPASYDEHFVWLFWLNVLVAALLALVVLIASWRLFARLRRGKFGSKLLLRLAAIFALVGVLPGVLIYTVSYQFVSRSIEVWFDSRVEGALDAGLNLGKGTLDALAADLRSKTLNAAERFGDGRSTLDPLTLERLREQIGAREITLVSASGQILLTASTTASIAPERPSTDLLRNARSQRAVTRIEGLEEDSPTAVDEAQVRAVALVPSIDISLASVNADDRFLVVVQPLPPTVIQQALAVQEAYREYQQRMLSRQGLRRMYIGTLTLTLVLSVFAAVLLAAIFGNQLARPLVLLAEGVAQVAKGDLSVKRVFPSNDEIGGLTRSFADMTDQLGQARSQAEASMRQLEFARTRLQTILDNLTAGVIVFDRERRIDTVNPGATRIMRSPLSAYVGRLLDEAPGMQAFAESVWQRFELHRTHPVDGERDHWQEAFDLPQGDNMLTLLVRGASLPRGARLVVFDDITEVVSAQRSAAWSEVARRLAHEIKNPLTPIQLSAERLQHKLSAKLEGKDADMLERSVATIVNQVQAMKQLVNEFRDYARLPAAKLVPLDLNAIVQEVLALYGDAQERGVLHARCAIALPRIRGDATQLRQIIHNLVQNALDAVSDRDDGHVTLTTETSLDDNGAPRAVRLKVEDNGAGFPEKVLQRAFEPYVTTKSKGTGLGLAVVKKIADEHGARVRIVNLPARAAGDLPGGAQVSLSFSTTAEPGEVPGPGVALEHRA